MVCWEVRFNHVPLQPSERYVCIPFITVFALAKIPRICHVILIFIITKRHFHGAREIVCFIFTCAILSYCPIKHHKEPFWYFAKITRGESEADLFNKKCIGPNRCCQAKSSMSYIRWGGEQCRRIVRARLFPVWNPTSFWYW